MCGHSTIILGVSNSKTNVVALNALAKEQQQKVKELHEATLQSQTLRFVLTNDAKQAVRFHPEQTK